MADGDFWSDWFGGGGFESQGPDAPTDVPSAPLPGLGGGPAPDQSPSPPSFLSGGVPDQPLVGLGTTPPVDLGAALNLATTPPQGLLPSPSSAPSPIATPNAIPTTEGGTLIRDAAGNLYRMSLDGRTLTPLKVFTESATGNIVVTTPDGQRVLLSQQDLQSVRAAAGKGDWGMVGRILDPVNRALGTNVGGTLAALGLGALGLGVSRAAAGPQPRFPAFTPAFTGIAANPQAQALERDIRMKNLAGLARISPGGTDQSLDPITVDLTTRLRKALAGEISNPILARQDALEKSQFENEMLRRSGSPLWRDSSAGIERGTRLDESQAIRRYLDNQNTIAALEPSLRGRQAQETETLARLSGLGTFDAQRQYEQGLQSQYDYNKFLTESQQRADLAGAIGKIFGVAAGGLATGSRRPWDRGPVTLG